ncbi:hypothetical protein SSPO_053930 [Streptomyces antimycoticus]|uniref:DUF4244 domain-containing protein n=1 Tax=Streptomyces antimycoticus TaxID=68175 RepID=A0A499UL43_9ACTN|nr:hypothetical protein SSPO_053930 [Streptomyces antimycoticus]
MPYLTQDPRFQEITIAACGFAAVLYKVVTSGTVSGALQSVIGRALDAQF